MWHKYQITKIQHEISEEIPMTAKQFKAVHRSNVAIEKNYRFMAFVLWMLGAILIFTMLSSFLSSI